jgi:hypothetical protein
MKLLTIFFGCAAAVLFLTLVIAYICFRIGFYAPPRKNQNSDHIDLPEGEIKRGRKIWLVGEGGRLEYHMIEEGVSDDAFTELKGGDKFEGRQAVIGYETAQTVKRDGDETVNPFAPKRKRPTTKGTAPEPKK